jgi:hypothetical protein
LPVAVAYSTSACSAIPISPNGSLLLEHDLLRKPVPTFRDHALAADLA